MPTKARVLREQAKKQAQAEAEIFFSGCIKRKKDIPDILDHLLKGCRWDNLVIYNKDDSSPEIHPLSGKGANDMRHNERHDCASNLRKKYKNIWNIRGAAKVIAIDEGLSIRTIQKYIKDFPIA